MNNILFIEVVLRLFVLNLKNRKQVPCCLAVLETRLLPNQVSRFQNMIL